MIVGKLIEVSDKRKSEKEYAKDTAVARLNMHNRNFLSQQPFYYGWSLVKLNDFRYAFINEAGEFLGNYLFARAENFYNGTSVVHIINKGDCILKHDGTFVLPPLNEKNKERFIKHLSEFYYLVSDCIHIKKDTVKYEYYIVRNDGIFITPKPFDKFLEFKDGIFKFQTGKLISEVDETGSLLCPPFSKKVDIGNGLYKVMENEYCWGVYNAKTDKIIIPCKYSDISYIQHLNSFILRTYPDELKRCFCSVIDLEGSIIIPSLECSIDLWGNNFYRIVKYRGEGLTPLFGIYNVNGKLLVQPNFSDIWVKDNHFFVSSNGGRCGKVNELGYSALEYDSYKLVYLSEWDFPIGVSNTTTHKGHASQAYACNPSYIIVSQNSRFGVVDINGEIIIPLEYDSIETVENEDNITSCYILKRGSKFGVADITGSINIPLEYDDILPKMDTGTSIYIPKHIISSHSEMWEDDEEMNNFDNYCKGKPRYFILKKGETSTTVNFKNEPYTPTPTRADFIRHNCEYPTAKIQSNTKNVIPEDPETKIYILFFDTETTGIPQNYNAPISDTNNWPRLVQLSWLLVDDNYNIVVENDVIIKPQHFIIPLSASKIHGITTQEAINKGIELSKALDMFIADVKKAQLCVGHNISFDKKIIGCELFRCGMRDVITPIPSICTMQSTVDICKIPGQYGYKYPKLQELYNYLFGINFADAHNSLADIKATLQCYKELKNRKLV